MRKRVYKERERETKSKIKEESKIDNDAWQRDKMEYREFTKNKSLLRIKLFCLNLFIIFIYFMFNKREFYMYNERKLIIMNSLLNIFYFNIIVALRILILLYYTLRAGMNPHMDSMRVSFVHSIRVRDITQTC